ncbi:MAG: sensor histidine kinase, partial [Pirellulales bacterium]
ILARTYILLGGVVAAGIGAAALALGRPDARTAVWTLGLLLPAGVCGALAAAAYTAGRLGRRIDSLRAALQRLAEGGDTGRLSAETFGELADVARDIEQTGRQVATRFAQLESDRQQLRAVLDSMAEGVIAVDAQQRIVVFNTAARTLLGLDETATDHPVWERVRHPQLQRWVSEALEQGEPAGGEIELPQPVTRYLSVRAAPLPGRPPRGAVVVAGDITELRRLERVRQEFVANASHELKTPLASIHACVETLMDGAMEDPKARANFLRTIEQQTQRLDRLVADMLTLARAESRQSPAARRPVSIDRAARACHQRQQRLAERKQIRLEIEPPPEPVLAVADDETLEQILDNLVDNAIKYTPQRGAVTVRWRAEDAEAVIEVQDTGVGIPRKQLQRVFERFYRVDRARSRDLGGTGLGLSIVKHLAQAHGGSVSATSQLGRGSTFSVRLPVHRAGADRLPGADLAG